MSGKKLSRSEKLYLKLTDREGYKKYKEDLRVRREEDFFFQRSKAINHPQLNRPQKPVTAFRHSGNIGDIIYSLPAAFGLANGGKLHYYLHVNQAADYQHFYHPLGNVLMNDKIVDMLTPLLSYQPSIAVAKKWEGEEIDFDLDEFRNYSFHLDRGSIVRWYFQVYATYYNSAEPWLIAPADERYKNTLVIARSHRYRSPVVDYSFLKEYPNKLFLGVKEEYEDMKKALPDLVHQPVTDFLEMATIINSCKLFIGNQSFPFSLAEALKANRLLEVYYKVPNVIVEGRGANDFMYQPQFEHAVKRLMGD